MKLANILRSATLLLLLPVAATVSAQQGSVRIDTAHMPSLGVLKHIIVYLPPSYARESARRYPVVYYLHGLTGAESNWSEQGRLDEIADSLMAGGMKEMIIVMPDGDDGWYTDWASATTRAQCAAVQRTEPAERYCVETPKYATYIARDVVAYIDSVYRTIPDRAHRGIAGLSMGGYGAIKLALQFPDVFSAAASHSGVLTMLLRGMSADGTPQYAQSMEEIRATRSRYQAEFEKVWGDDVARWRDNDPATLVSRLVRARTTLPEIYIDTGTEDALTPTNRAFRSELRKLGVPHEYQEYPGAHTWTYWRAHAPHSLQWLAAHIAR